MFKTVLKIPWVMLRLGHWRNIILVKHWRWGKNAVRFQNTPSQLSPHLLGSALLEELQGSRSGQISAHTAHSWTVFPVLSSGAAGGNSSGHQTPSPSLSVHQQPGFTHTGSKPGPATSAPTQNTTHVSDKKETSHHVENTLLAPFPHPPLRNESSS